MNTCMLKNRKSQLSITMIITAIIGLIILVVIVLMLTGNLGAFGEGTSEASGCETVCKAIGKVKHTTDQANAAECKTAKGQYIFGDYSDVSSGVCCCEDKLEITSTGTTTPTTAPTTPTTAP